MYLNIDEGRGGLADVSEARGTPVAAGGRGGGGGALWLADNHRCSRSPEINEESLNVMIRGSPPSLSLPADGDGKEGVPRTLSLQTSNGQLHTATPLQTLPHTHTAQRERVTPTPLPEDTPTNLEGVLVAGGDGVGNLTDPLLQSIAPPRVLYTPHL